MYSRDWVRFENSGAAALASNTSSGVATNESVSGDWPIRADTNLPDDKGLALVFAKRTQFSFFLRCRADALQDRRRMSFAPVRWRNLTIDKKPLRRLALQQPPEHRLSSLMESAARTARRWPAVSNKVLFRAQSRKLTG